MNTAARKITNSASNGAAYRFESSGYCNSGFKSMHFFQQSKMFCDVTIMVGRVEYSAHRIVLVAVSQYFADVLQSEDRSEANRVVEIDLGATSPLLFQVVLEYIYTGKITITEDNIRDLIMISKILQITSLETACGNAISVLLSPANWYILKTVAGAECSEAVHEICRSYAWQHFAEITDTEAFLRLTIDEVKELVADHQVSVISEDEKYSAVLKWVKHDLLERKGNLFELMKSIQLLLMDSKFFMENVFPEDLLRLDLECITRVLDNTKYHIEMQSGSASSIRPDLRKNTKNKLLSYIFVTGGWNINDLHSMSDCEVYNSETNTWHAIASMQNKRSRHAVIGLGELLYAFGGMNGQQTLSSAEYYDPGKNAWSFTTPLHHGRYGHAICSLNGAIFICGGEHNNILSTVEQFDVTTAKYTTCAAMNSKRTAFKTAAIGGCIYAIGGWNGRSLKSVEKYDPREGRWSPEPSMRTSRYYSGVTVLNDYIYCTGGGCGARMSGERFDIRKNIWERIPEMLTKRYGHKLVTLDGSVYAVGGYQLNSVEKFDPNTNRWVEMPSMLKERQWLGASVLNCLEIKHP